MHSVTIFNPESHFLNWDLLLSRNERFLVFTRRDHILRVLSSLKAQMKIERCMLETSENHAGGWLRILGRMVVNQASWLSISESKISDLEKGPWGQPVVVSSWLLRRITWNIYVFLLPGFHHCRFPFNLFWWYPGKSILRSMGDSS